MDIDRLRSTWREVAEYGDDVPLHFYARLFLAHPELRAMFPSGMSGQRDRLVKALGRILQQVDNPAKLGPFLEQLGANHAAKYGVRPEHYPWVGQALLETLQYFLGPTWSEEVRQDWTEAYTAVSEAMMQGAATAPAGIVTVGPIGESDGATSLTAKALREWRLPTTSWRGARGYDRRAVDELISLAAGELDQRQDDILGLRTTITSLRARVSALQDYYRGQNSDLQVEEAMTASAAAADAIALMSRTQLLVDRLMSDAQDQAQGMVADVRRRCEALLAQAQQQTQGAVTALSAVMTEFESWTGEPNGSPSSGSTGGRRGA